MTINTKEPYLLINENNFEDIINHERNGNNLKKNHKFNTE